MTHGQGRAWRRVSAGLWVVAGTGAICLSLSLAGAHRGDTARTDTRQVVNITTQENPTRSGNPWHIRRTVRTDLEPLFICTAEKDKGRHKSTHTSTSAPARTRADRHKGNHKGKNKSTNLLQSTRKPC